MKRTTVLGVILGSALVLNVMVGESVQAGDVGGSAYDPVVRATEAFSFSLYAKVREEEKGNIFFSPFSIHSALTMTSLGANGKTREQMMKTLCLVEGDDSKPWSQQMVCDKYRVFLDALASDAKSSSYTLETANALWGQKDYPWLDSFLATTRRVFGADLKEVDFIHATESSRQTINKWVEDKTNDKIKDLLPKGILTELTRLVLTNAIYFKGDWASAFGKKQTRDMPFRVSSEKSEKVPMMYQKHRFGYAETKDLQLLVMPYKGNELSMAVILPRKPSGISGVEEDLAGQALSSWMKGVHWQEVHVYLPKFKTTIGLGLKAMLEKMGMPMAFNARQADFSAMDGRRDLSISAVIHKAFVDVNEEGTEAAAATAVVMTKRESVSIRPRVPIFRADHPFIFLIRHNKTGAILFLGRVMNPRE